MGVAGGAGGAAGGQSVAAYEARGWAFEVDAACLEVSSLFPFFLFFLRRARRETAKAERVGPGVHNVLRRWASFGGARAKPPVGLQNPREGNTKTALDLIFCKRQQISLNFFVVSCARGFFVYVFLRSRKNESGVFFFSGGRPAARACHLGAPFRCNAPSPACGPAGVQGGAARPAGCAQRRQGLAGARQEARGEKNLRNETFL